MIDKKQEITPATEAAPTDPLLTQAQLREKSPANKKRERTGGEVAFDRIVYTGIGFGVNEASAIVIADEFEHGVGKKWFSSISDWMVKNLKFKETIKNGVTVSAKANASNMLMWGSLLISGTLLVLPMKKLEDNKEYWVQKLNHWLDKGKLTPEETEARDNEVKKALAEEPKQSWPSLAIGRSIAVVTALGLGKVIGAEGSQKMKNWSEKLLTGSVQEKKNRAHRYAAIASLETLSCAATSIALEFSSKYFAKRNITVRDPDLHDSFLDEPNVVTTHKHKAAANNESGTNGENAIKHPVALIPAEVDKFAHLKKKPVVKMDSHVDAVKASETNFSLAP